MKKLLFGILVVCLALCMVGCDASIIGKLAETMGKLGNNIYGIEANLESVTETTASVDAAVETKTDGSVEVKLDAAAAITGDIAEIASSPQKTEALKTEMSKPVADNAETAEKVKTQLEEKKAEVVTAATTAIDTSSAPAEVKAALKTVVSNISNIPVSENPTKAELVTVAVVTELAKTLQDNASKIAGNDAEAAAARLALIAKAQETLMTIKTVNKTDINLLQGVDLGSLINGLKGLSKDGAKTFNDQFLKYLSMIRGGVNKILITIGTTDNQLNPDGYTRFVANMSALRTAYESGAYGVRQYVVDADAGTCGLEGIDAFIANGKTLANGKYTSNDLILYLVSVVFSEAEKVSKINFNGTQYNVRELINEVLKANMDLLNGASDDFESTDILDAFVSDLQATLEDKAKLQAGLAAWFGGSTQEEVIKNVMDRVALVANTALVLAVDSGYGSALKMIPTNGAELEVFLNTSIGSLLTSINDVVGGMTK